MKIDWRKWKYNAGIFIEYWFIPTKIGAITYFTTKQVIAYIFLALILNLIIRILMGRF